MISVQRRRWRTHSGWPFRDDRTRAWSAHICREGSSQVESSVFSPTHSRPLN